MASLFMAASAASRTGAVHCSYSMAISLVAAIHPTPLAKAFIATPPYRRREFLSSSRAASGIRESIGKAPSLSSVVPMGALRIASPGGAQEVSIRNLATDNKNKKNRGKGKGDDGERERKGDVGKSDKEKTGPRFNKRPHGNNLQRADRVLSSRGISSRSEAFRLIKAGRISVMNEQTGEHKKIAGPSAKIPPASRLFIDSTHELSGPVPLILIYHKPKYVLSAMSDKGKRKTLGGMLEQYSGPFFESGKLHPVGRLDYDTSGLILFSSSGELTHRLLHPRSGVEKEYVATVQGLVDVDDLRERLENGVETAEGTHKAKLLDVALVEVAEEQMGGGSTIDKDEIESNRSGALRWESEGPKNEAYEAGTSEIFQAWGGEEEDGEVSDMGSDKIDRNSPDGSEILVATESFQASKTEKEERHDGKTGAGGDKVEQQKWEGPRTDVRLIVTEGKHRMVRRMLANCGHPVEELRRERHGGVVLGDLKAGSFREVQKEELKWAKKLLKKKVKLDSEDSKKG